MNNDLQITIGTLGTLKLKDANSQEKEIFFDADNKRIPIPNYIYKIIDNKTSGEKEVFVFNNNPYESKTNIEFQIQAQFGAKAEKLSGNFEEVNRGYTFKVPYNDFVEVIDINLTNTITQKHSIPLNDGEIRVQQHPTLLHVQQVSYEMPKTKDQVKGS